MIPRPQSARDMAFADTIHVRDLDEPPPSGPVIVNDPDQGAHWMTPRSFPLPAPRGASEPLGELWRQTLELVDEREGIRAWILLRRLRALWSFWQWERGDILRAGVIGLAVFAVASTLGAVILKADAPEARDEVRAPRTARR